MLPVATLPLLIKDFKIAVGLIKFPQEKRFKRA